jgi:hypothetical protein
MKGEKVQLMHESGHSTLIRLLRHPPLTTQGRGGEVAGWALRAEGAKITQCDHQKKAPADPRRKKKKANTHKLSHIL